MALLVTLSHIHDDHSHLSPPLPLPTSFWNVVPFLCVGNIALISTTLLVFQIETIWNESKILDEHHS